MEAEPAAKLPDGSQSQYEPKWNSFRWVMEARRRKRIGQVIRLRFPPRREDHIKNGC
jgi:hypothetical protein